MNLKFEEINFDTDIYRIIQQEDQGAFPVYAANSSKLKRKFSDYIVQNFMINEEYRDTEIGSLYQYMKDYNKSIEASKNYIYFYQVRNKDCSAEILMSLLYAKFTGKKIAVFDDTDILFDFSFADSVMFIVPSDYTEMQSYIMSTQNQAKILCGFLPYENKSTLNFSLAKLLVAYEQSGGCKHLLINRISEKEDEVEKRKTDSEEFYYFPKKSANLSNLGDIFFQSTRLLEFNYVSHCRHCTLYFSDFYFCGKQEKNADIDKIAEKKHLPCCYYDPDKCSIEDRKKINASYLNADIVFLNGCNLGDLNESILPYRFNLVPNLINNNAISIITSPSIKVGSEVENIFAYNLLKYGYTEGKKLFYVNRFMEYSTIEDSLFFLIGDPCLKVVKDEQKHFHMKIELTGDYSFKIELSDIEEHTMLQVDIPNIYERSFYISNIYFTTESRNEIQKTDHIYFFQDNDKNNIRLFLFSNRPYCKGKVTIDFTVQDEIKDKINRVMEHVKNFNFYKNNFVLNNIIKGGIVDYKNNIKRVYTLRKECRYKVKTLHEMKRFLNKMETRASNLYKEVFTAIVEYTLNKKDNYYERISEKRVPVKSNRLKSRCILCGKDEYVYPYKLFTIEEEYIRSSLKCINCSIIRDIPDDKLAFYDYGSSKFETGGTECEVIKIVNKHDHDIDISIAPICLTSDKIDVKPSSYTNYLKSNEGYIFKFKISPKSAILKHFYLFSFYVIADGKFYYYSKMISYR